MSDDGDKANSDRLGSGDPTKMFAEAVPRDRERQERVELTLFSKADGPLTKHISLSADGKIISDGSACCMVRGKARRARIGGLQALASLIDEMKSNQALALGALRPELPDEVEIATKNQVINGVPQPGTIARTNANITYRKNTPALVLLDFDAKGMAPEVAQRLEAAGGFWGAVISIAPELRSAAHLMRRSTSAGLIRTDTGEKLQGSRGIHTYLIARDGRDAKRFLTALHQRAWLSGYGWLMVGAAGQILQRSIVDRLVWGPERLVFEGPPELDPPLAHDADVRRPIVTDGELIDTLKAAPPLTVAEQYGFQKLIAEATQKLEPTRRAARDAHITRIAAQANIPREEAKRRAAKQEQGILTDDFVLQFDSVGKKTVGDVLDNPKYFEDLTLADPLEGVSYGRGKAKVMLGFDELPWINSFAHGGVRYRLKYSVLTARSRIAAATDPIAELRRMVILADLDQVEEKELINEVSERTKSPKRELTAEIKLEKQRWEQARAREVAERRLAERSDPRPAIGVPAADAPLLPVMAALNDFLGSVQIPPTRNIEGFLCQLGCHHVVGLHAFSSATVNAEGGRVELMARPAYGGRTTCESCASIDVRRWHREGRLQAGQHFSWSWTRGSEPSGSIRVRMESDAAVLIYRSRSRSASEWKSIEQRVPITWTACHLGGRRPWFVCSVYSGRRYCGRRVAVLYGAGELFACRRCHGLAYASQQETPMHRALGQAQKIRKKLGGSTDIWDRFPERPKRMHRRTYLRLRARGEAAQDSCNDSMTQWLGRTPRRLKGRG
jgi:hypothetical protein